MIRLVLPLPPSANNLFVSVNGRPGGKTRAKGEAYRAWLHAAGWTARLQLASIAARGMPTKIGGSVAVSLRIGCDRRRDLDNTIKGLLDLLVRHLVIEDDRWVDRIVAERDPSCVGSAIAEVEAMDGNGIGAGEAADAGA